MGYAAIPVRRLAISLITRVSPARRVGRIVLADLVGDAGAKRRLDLLEEALEHVEAVQPRSYAQLQRNLRRVLIISRGGQVYDFDIKACILDVAFVDRQEPTGIAGALVHEGVHARLDDLGIRYHNARRPAIERIAVRAQLDFLNAAGAPEQASALRAASKAEWWSDEAAVLRQVDQMRGFSVPPRIIRFCRRLLGYSSRTDD